MVLKNNWICK